MNRRHFLQKSSMLLTSWPAFAHLLSASPVFAISAPQNNDDHFFLLLEAAGGMDVTLGLAPYLHKNKTTQNDIFIEYRDNDLVLAGNLILGPSATPLKSHAYDIQIINGINMKSDLGHTLRYMSSGSTAENPTSLPIELAAAYKSGPFGVVTSSDEISLGKRAIVKTLTSTLTHRENEADGAPLILPENEEDSSATHQMAVNGYNNSHELKKKFQMNYKNYLASQKANIPFFASDVSAIAFAFMSGLTYQASLSINNLNQERIILDTHAGHERNHFQSQFIAWETVSQIFSLFKSIEYKNGSLFDHTTFMVVSEFSRTPYLNGAGGKDHNPETNSVLLAGKGVAGNTVIGGNHVVKKSDSKTGASAHQATAIDYKTGTLVLKKSEILDNMGNSVGLIYPENIVRSIAKIFKDPYGFSSVSLEKIRPIPGVIKT